MRDRRGVMTRRRRTSGGAFLPSDKVAVAVCDSRLISISVSVSDIHRASCSSRSRPSGVPPARP